jgi:hypothetical protein
MTATKAPPAPAVAKDSPQRLGLRHLLGRCNR